MSSSDQATAGRLGHDAATKAGWLAGQGFWRIGALAAALWLAVGWITLLWPNVQVGFTEWGYTRELGIGLVLLGIGLAIAALPVQPVVRATRRLRVAGPWLLVLAEGK